MADLSSFSSNEFKAASWINSIIDEIPDGENIESYVSSLSMKLHIAAQDYSEQLETAMVESISTIPRIVSEINRLEDQLKSVQSEMKSISNHIHAVDKSSISGVEELSRLDHLKSNMERSKSTLEEHARWSQLVRKSGSLLENGEMLADAADCIQIMSKSLEILRKLPGHDERQSTYESFRSQLLASVRPNLQKDIQTFNLASLQEYLYVFRKLNSEEHFEQEYTTTRPEKLRVIWKQSMASTETLSYKVSSYLANTLKFLVEEEDHLLELFGSDRLESTILHEALLPLQQELPMMLKATSTIPMTMDCYGTLDEFSKRIAKTLLRLTDNERVMILDRLFVGMISYLPQYYECEEKVLKEQMAGALNAFSFHLDKQSHLLQGNGGIGGGGGAGEEDDFGDWYDPLELIVSFVDGLLKMIPTVPRLCQDSLSRSSQVFGGLNLRPMMKLLVNILLLFLKQLQLKINNFATSIGLEGTDLSSSATTTTANSTEQQLEKPLTSLDRYTLYTEELKQANKLAHELAHAEHDKQTLIACALKVLQAMGRLTKSLQEVDEVVKQVCGDLQRQLLSEIKFPQDVELYEKGNGLGSAYGLYVVNKDINQIAELKSFLANNSGLNPSYSQGVLTNVTKMMRKTIERSGDILIKLSTTTPIKLLASYPLEDGWNKKTRPDELEDLAQNLLPQSIVTQVGEHLLSWVQDLESFASSDAFTDLQSLVIDHVALVRASTGWEHVKTALEIVDEKGIDQLADRSSCCKMIKVLEKEMVQWSRAHAVKFEAVGVDVDLFLDNEETVLDSNENGQVIVFVNEWLSLISDAIVGVLLSQILKISELSAFGSLQLQSDIEYLSNVINALGIKAHPLLVFVKLLLQEDVGTLSNCLQALNSGKSLGALKDVLKLALSIAYCRKNGE